MFTIALTILLLSLLFTATWLGGARAQTPGLAWFKDQRSELRQAANRARENRCRGQVHSFYLQAREVRRWKRDDVLEHWRDMRERARSQTSRCTPWYVTKQIWAGNILGRESLGDPWPNCPDPWDGGGYSWTDTVNCENGGSWLDSPGFYRCGLQFHPNWENRFGRLCP